VSIVQKIFKVFDKNDVTIDHADGIRSAGKAKQEGQLPLTGQRAPISGCLSCNNR